MKRHIHWFRNDLRLHDQPWFDAASKADHYFGVYILDPCCLAWMHAAGFSFRRMDLKRLYWLRANLAELQLAHRTCGTELYVFVGDPVQILKELTNGFESVKITANKEWAPEEIAIEKNLEKAGISVNYSDSGGLFSMEQLLQIPVKQRKSFTPFRQFIEQNGWYSRTVNRDAIGKSPPSSLPDGKPINPANELLIPGTGFPFKGGSVSGKLRLDGYLKLGKIDRYKETRNGLMGADYSGKFSPWLALGSLSAAQINEALAKFEQQNGKSEGSYWMWFELLWREFFRLQMAVHGSRMFQMGGITNKTQPVSLDSEQFKSWCMGETASDFVNAGMIELRLTGFLSNRMRQICASYLIHELQQDWRWGAAWFEAHLLDYDVHSNYGNWAYIAGAGNDPRGGRHFSIQKQQEMYDPDGSYTDFWMAMR
jgi:deoxyribodipyrimidine photo-lyase